MLNQIGLTDNILTLIERRGKADLMIFFGLCIGTLLFIYVLFNYVKPMLTLSYIFGYGAASSPEAPGTDGTLSDPAPDSSAHSVGGLQI